MAIDIQIQDENGNALATYAGPLIGSPFLKLAPVCGACLRFVLPWADVTFNSEQIKELRGELLQVMRNAREPERIREAKALIEFIEGAQGTHTYVKFIGD